VIQQKENFFGPSATQFTFIDSNGILNIPAQNPEQLFSNVPIDCLAAQNSFTTQSNYVQLSTTFAQTNSKGWYMYFIGNENDNGVNYNKLSIIYDDGINPIDVTDGTFRYISLLPVNDAPVINISSPQNGSSIPISYETQLFLLNPTSFTGSDQVNGNANLTAVINNPLNFGLVFDDVDAFGNPNIDFEITITANSNGNKDTSPSLAGFPKDVPGADIASNSIKFTTSILQANIYVATLYFQTKKQGNYDVTVTVNDNGFTGRYCPPGADFDITQTSCPRTTIVTLHINAVTNANLITGVATGVGAGVLGLAALGALLGAKFFKPKETDAWDEWDDNNLGDQALSNPLYNQQTQVNANQIYTGN